MKNYKCFYYLILLFSKIKRKYLAIPCLLVLWFDLVPQKSGSCSLDSGKPPGVRGNWWLFGSFLECEMLFSTGFMSSEAWELQCLKGPGNAGEGWTIRWVKKGNSLEAYSDQKLQENSYILCLILYMTVES